MIDPCFSWGKKSQRVFNVQCKNTFWFGNMLLLLPPVQLRLLMYFQ